MKIKNITASGLKSGHFSHALGPVTLVTGDNFSGKTARLDAIRLGLIGYVPELGRQNGATFGLCAGSELDVGLTFDSGATMYRRWRMERGSIKATMTGELPTIPPVLMDPAEYFAMGDKDRVRYVFRLVSSDDDDKAALTVIAAVRGIKVEGGTDRHEAVLRSIVDDLNESDNKRNMAGESVAAWIEGQLAAMRETLRTTKQAVDRLDKTVTGLAAVKADDEAVAVRDTSQEIRTLQGWLQERSGQRGKVEETIEADSRTNARHLAAKLVLDGMVDPAPAIDDIEAKLVELDRRCAVVSRMPGIVALYIAANGRLAQARAEATALDQQAKELADELQAKLQLKACPFCGAAAEGWQDHLRADYDVRIRATNSAWITKAGEVDEYTLEVRAIEEEKRMDSEADLSRQLAITEAQSLRQKLTVLRRDEQKINEARQTVALLQPVTTESLAGLRRQSDTLTRDIDGGTVKLRTLQERQQRFTREQEATRLAAQAAEKNEQDRDRLAVLKATVAVMETEQERMVESAFTCILALANDVTTGILRGTLAYHGGEIGRWQDGAWIGHRTFSGTEKALAYAGISVALAQSSPIRIVLLDEMGRLTAENKRKLAQRLIEMEAVGKIDQAVMVDVAEKDFNLVEGLHIIEL